ncbi:hypothetical protein FACS189468_8630 [Spirochaetia bacterium]|nr:hypothetical protein FACS189468_8630 [Spirochaetia bacterium]
MNPMVNEPKKNGLFVRIRRNFIEHRALWMYLLCDEARKKGLDPETFAPEAIRRCGLYHGKLSQDQGGSQTLKTLTEQLFPRRTQKIFEMKIRRLTEDQFDVDFHYCPLVKAWQKQGCAGEEMDRMCEWAMWGDRGIAESYGCELELKKTIARGDGICEIRFKRKQTT